jgi:hypothetical protein
MMDSYQIAVSRGVALLDREMGDWRSRIDLAKLDMSRLDSDVLAQLFGAYITGLEQLGVPLDTTDDVDCGFDVPIEIMDNSGLAYKKLTEEWKLRIKGASL